MNTSGVLETGEPADRKIDTELREKMVVTAGGVLSIVQDSTKNVMPITKG